MATKALSEFTGAGAIGAVTANVVPVFSPGLKKKRLRGREIARPPGLAKKVVEQLLNEGSK